MASSHTTTSLIGITRPKCGLASSVVLQSAHRLSRSLSDVLAPVMRLLGNRHGIRPPVADCVQTTLWLLMVYGWTRLKVCTGFFSRFDKFVDSMLTDINPDDIANILTRPTFRDGPSLFARHIPPTRFYALIGCFRTTIAYFSPCHRVWPEREWVALRSRAMYR